MLLAQLIRITESYLRSGRMVLSPPSFAEDELRRRVVHKYRTDYLEVKGQETQQDATKREFLTEWVRAVSQSGAFGEWSADVSRNPRDLLNILKTHNSA